MAKEKTYALAKSLLRYDRLDPKSNKAARAQSSNDEVTLDKRRLDYQHEGNELKVIIDTIQDLQRDAIKIGETLVEARKQPDASAQAEQINKLVAQKNQIEETQTALSNLANLRSLVVLHQGLALLVDCMTVEQYERDEEDRKKKTFMRVPISDLMFDCAQFMLQLDKRMKKQTTILNEMAIAQHAVQRGQFIPTHNGVEIDEEEEDDELEEPAPEGVPPPAPEKLTKDKVIQMVRDPKKETHDATGAERG